MVRLNDCPDMTIAVYYGCKATKQHFPSLVNKVLGHCIKSSDALQTAVKHGLDEQTPNFYQITSLIYLPYFNVITIYFDDQKPNSPRTRPHSEVSHMSSAIKTVIVAYAYRKMLVMYVDFVVLDETKSL